MNKFENSAILIVSFGTSKNQAIVQSLDKIVYDAKIAFPDYNVYHAWTSRYILSRRQKDESLRFHVNEILDRLEKKQISTLLVQPTFLMFGGEYERLEEELLRGQNRFNLIKLGKPLIASLEDADKVITSMPLLNLSKDDETVILVCHSYSGKRNHIYSSLEYRFHEQGFKNVCFTPIEDLPDISPLINRLKQMGSKKVILSPFMVVAGGHAYNDLAGEHDLSYKRQLEAAGFSVRCHLEGLGQYMGVRQICIDHLKEIESTSML